MKQLISTAVIAILASVGTYHFMPQSADSSSVQKEETAYERVMRTGTLRCGYAPWQPGVIVDPNTGDISGVFPDIMNAIALNSSIKVEWTEEIGWGNVATSLETGRIDAMCAGVWEGADEGKSTAFITPPFFQPILTVARLDENRFKNDPSLLNHSDVIIAVIDGDNSESIAKSDFPKATRHGVSTLGNNSDLLLAIVNNKADVAFVNPGSFITFNENNPNKLKVVGDTYVRIYGTTIAVNIKEQELVSFLNASIHELINSGEIKRITAKYPKYKLSLINRTLGYEKEK